MNNLTAERLRELFDYCPTTGIFTRKVNRKKWKSGQVAGSFAADGYVHIGADYVVYKAHRLAWMFVYGKMPNGEIDHINNCKTDNRICNLRDTTRQLNEHNKHAAQSNNKSCGLRGVTFDRQRGKWRTRVVLGKLLMHCSFHNYAETAHKAYVEAKSNIHTY